MGHDLFCTKQSKHLLQISIKIFIPSSKWSKKIFFVQKHFPVSTGQAAAAHCSDKKSLCYLGLNSPSWLCLLHLKHSLTKASPLQCSHGLQKASSLTCSSSGAFEDLLKCSNLITEGALPAVKQPESSSERPSNPVLESSSRQSNLRGTGRGAALQFVTLPRKKVRLSSRERWSSLP